MLFGDSLRSVVTMPSDSETEQTAQEIRDDINRIAGIDQSVEQPGYFTKDELEGIVEYIVEREQEISPAKSTQKEGDRSDD